MIQTEFYQIEVSAIIPKTSKASKFPAICEVTGAD